MRKRVSVDECIEILELAEGSVDAHIPSNIIDDVIYWLGQYEKLKLYHSWDTTDNRGEFC